MKLPRLGECRDCHEPIRFVNLPNGGCVPVQPAPRPDRAGAIAAQVISGRLYGHFIGERDPAARADLIFTPHREVCTERGRTRGPAPVPAAPDPDPTLFDPTEET